MPRTVRARDYDAQGERRSLLPQRPFRLQFQVGSYAETPEQRLEREIAAAIDAEDEAEKNTEPRHE